MKGIKMNKILLFTFSSNELSNAQIIQRQIFQKDLQIELLNINNRYQPTLGFSNSSNMLNLQNMLLEKSRLISQRDNYLSNAISYALDIVQDDINQKVDGLISTGSMAINSIVSFITVHSITFALSFPVRVKLYQILAKLSIPDYAYWNLRIQLNKLLG